MEGKVFCIDCDKKLNDYKEVYLSKYCDEKELVCRCVGCIINLKYEMNNNICVHHIHSWGDFYKGVKNGLIKK